MKSAKKKLITKVTLAFLIVLIVGGFSIPKIFHLGISKSLETDYGEPVSVKNGISVLPSAKGDVSDKDVDELIDEYGTDSNIIIYDVGR